MEEESQSFLSLLTALEKEEENNAGAAPAQEPDEVEEPQPLPEDADQEMVDEEEYFRALCYTRAQEFWESLEPTEREDATITAIEDMADSQYCDAEECAAMLDVLVENNNSNLEHVPRIVRCIHRWLTTNTDASAKHRLNNTLLELTNKHTQDVVMTLLHWFPRCDRAAGTMWKVMVSASGTAEKVLPKLICVLEDWPLHSTSTSDGDHTDIFALAATRVIWEVLQLTPCPWPVEAHFSHLFLALLFQVFLSTKQMPEEVAALWRECQEEGQLPSSPNRFIVLTVRALLCSLDYEDVLLEIERKRGWDTLLSAETHHCAMGLLAREVRIVLWRSCSSMVCYLIKVLSSEEPRCKVPAMAFLVELLICPEIKRWHMTVLDLVPRYLRSQCRVMHRLTLRALLVLCQRTKTAKKMHHLVPSLIELLQDADGEVVTMTLFVLRKLFPTLTTSTVIHKALQLAEALQPLFDSDVSHVQLLSIRLFRDVMESVKERKEALKTHVRQSLLPLAFHLHDESKHVAEASRQTLFQAASFLKNRKLKKHLKGEIRPWGINECLLSEFSNSRDEFVQQALRYLQSPQESIQQEAIRFLGIAGRHVVRQQEKLRIIYEAIQGMKEDSSLFVSNLATQTLFVLRSAERSHSSRFSLPVVQDRLRRAWRSRPPLRFSGWLCW